MAKKKDVKPIQTTTKKPTGLSVKRSGDTFALSWKIGDVDYKDGQQFQYLLDRVGVSDSYVPQTIGVNATSKSIPVTKSNYYPYANKPALVKVVMRVRGNRKKYSTGKKSKKKKKNTYKEYEPIYSDWASKDFVLQVPKVPSLSATLNGTYSNLTTFSWSTPVAASDAFYFTDTEWQTMLVKDCNKSLDKLAWNSKTAVKDTDNHTTWASGTSSASGSKPITEDTTLLAKGSYTRCFRIRSRGPRGASAWKYAKHVYAMPNRATVKKATASIGANTYKINVTWSVGQPVYRPVDLVTVQYAIAVPDANMACPNGAGWTDANVSKDTAGSDSAVFYIDDQLSLDQCLFVRVNTQHDSNVSYGVPTFVKGWYLSDPSDLNIQADSSTHKINITNVTNNSSVPDSVIVVSYHPTKGSASNIAILSHGQTEKTGIQCPNWGSTSPTIGVTAFVGTYKASTKSGVTYYSLNKASANKYMAAKNIVKTGGQIPVRPNNVVASQTAVPGSVKVGWDWTWTSADAAEISWSDHRDAWESTDEPDTYIVSHIHTSQWNIAGLETGIKWYIRVRLISGTGDDATYGPYSDIVEIDLSSAPSKPVLSLSDVVIPQDGSVTASWVYSTTDGTAQAYAEICEVEVNANGIRYGVYRLSKDTSVMVKSSSGTLVSNRKTYYTRSGSGTYDSPYTYTRVTNVSQSANPHNNQWYEFISSIAHTQTAQHITLSAQEMGWESGNIYSLAVRVVSASGKVSDEWSDPVSVTVAEPLSATITQNSLEQKTIENIRQLNGEVVNFTTTGQEEFRGVIVNLEPVQSGEGDPSPQNIRPIAGWDDATVYLSDSHDVNEATAYVTEFESTIYKGTLDVISGVLTETWGYIASYDGETLPGEWISDRDVYYEDELEEQTPTTGAQVVYELETPVVYELTAQSISTLVGENYVWSDAGFVDTRSVESSRTVQALTEMPMTVTVTGAGEGGITSVALERSESYHMDRPDENTFNGFEGETVALSTHLGEDQFQFDTRDLIGSLDDGANYRIVATVQDGLGQSAETSLDFEVHWDHQAPTPSATVVIDEDNLVAKITPVAPSGAIQSDVADIYRLSIDKPELIYKGATFGQTYVDPYPALGEMGGHRVVLRTKNGDYITPDNQIAWFDTHEDEDDIIETDYNINIIDFEGTQIQFYYDTDYSNQWSKDFTQTEYLGGSIQGDWNPAVSRTGTINTLAITTLDQEMLQAVRRLATYPGICHVRTADGSSYAADIQVAEDRSHTDQEMLVSYSLNITRVDPEGYEGMTLKDWEELHPGDTDGGE